MAKDRKTNNPSTSTLIHAKNRPIILLVNRRSILVQTSHRLPYIYIYKTLCLEIMFVLLVSKIDRVPVLS